MTPARISHAIAALLCVGLALPSLAQDTATPAPETGVEAGVTPDAATATDAPAPVPASDAAQLAAPTEADVPNLSIDTFGDWELRCDTASGTCFMYQLVRDENANPVAEINILDLPEGGEAALGATVITPLGTLLSEGLVIQVDQNPGRQYAYNWCTRAGCFVRFGLAQSDVAAMRAGSVARMRILSASNPTAPVVLTVSLTGFTAASNALQN